MLTDAHDSSVLASPHLGKTGLKRKIIMEFKFRIAGFVALVLAGLSWLAETAFYGHVDPDGVLQESFFMPLTFILTALGLILIFASLLLKQRQ